MTVWGFANRETAETLRQMATRPRVRDTGTTAEEGANWEIRTPSAGIPGKLASAETYPSAECDLFYLVTDSANVIRRVQALDGSTPIKLRVGNRSTTAIPGNRFVSATRYIGGVYIVIVDEKRTAAIIQTPGGGIAEMSGTTPGSASCTVFQIVGGSLVSAAESITVLNTAASAVAGGVYAQANRESWSDAWVIDYEKRTAAIIQTPGGGIAAMSGTTPGSASCTVFQIVGGSLVSASESITVRNIAASAVAGNVYAQAKRESWSDAWVIDYEVCP